MAVYRLDDGLWFPDPHLGEPSGLVAVGGDLSVDRLLLAYSHGFFPWYSFQHKSEPWWFCPLDRFVIFPKEIHVSHSMKQMLRNPKYEVTFDDDFEGVINGCAMVDNRIDQEGAWLGADIIEAYTEMHRRGFAMSVEVWEKEVSASAAPAEGAARSGEAGRRRLVGGLYGITLGSAFFGESMFSLVPSASKLALIGLAKIMEHGGRFIDCQFETDHLVSMGGRHITYEEYIHILRTGTPLP